MFGLFKKKTEPAAPAAAEQGGAEFKAFAADFLPEELDILAVTGASGFNGGKAPGKAMWTAGIELTAWMEEDSAELHREQAQLVALADDRLMDYLRQRVPRDFILKCRVRPAPDNKRFLMLDLPQPAFDPELKSILEEQKKPVTFETEDFGTFTLNRAIGWFEANANWLGTEIALDFDRDEDRDGCLSTARALFAQPEDWDRRVRAFAAEKLLSLANDWARDGAEEGADPESITPEQFMGRIELQSIQVYPDGSFEFWFQDGDLFWGHAIRVSGSLTGGPEDAETAG